MDAWMELTLSALRMSAPVWICAMGAICSERSGVVNIGLEGMMLTGAFWGAAGTYYAGPAWGILSAMAAATLLALLHAVVTVSCRVDQIVSGVAVNILAYGMTRFFSFSIFGMAGSSPNISGLPKLSFGGGSDISWLVPVSLLLVAVTWFVLSRTVFGLRLRSAGENPAAADSLGISVTRYRYTGVLLSGAFAGLAGAYLSIEHTGMYVEGMTQGKGFIALAAMIFGNWNPWGALVASAMFGLSESVSFRMVESKAVPYQFIKMIPYLLTLLALAGLGRKTRPPAAVGQPYSRNGAL